MNDMLLHLKQIEADGIWSVELHSKTIYMKPTNFLKIFADAEVVVKDLSLSQPKVSLYDLSVKVDEYSIHCLIQPNEYERNVKNNG